MGRFAITDSFAIRGSVSTGFSAPTVGMEERLAISNGFDEETQTTSTSGTFPVSHPVAIFYGAVPLQPSESTNYSFGFTWQSLGGTTLTVDAYQIEVDDQLDVGVLNRVSPTDRPQLAALGVGFADTLTSAEFLTNQYDSETRGLDIVLGHGWDWDNGSSTDLTVTLNWFEKDLINGPGRSTNDDRRFTDGFERGDPEIVGNIRLIHSVGDWDLGVTARYYDTHYDGGRIDEPNPADIREYPAETLIDINVVYNISDQWNVSLIGNNITDVEPPLGTTDIPFGRFFGKLYRTGARYGEGLGTWQLATSYRF